MSLTSDPTCSPPLADSVGEIERCQKACSCTRRRRSESVEIDIDGVHETTLNYSSNC
ncbi:hypothetical protein PAXRUDRAFT_825257 [Paxillus rubicundulus Ve08.2h10]|uniref:Uncharacterized protein n=1 Tax=Paxillus rubicundulus Ve08.2h10 TaxID=930991 RepID=A0A0D0DGM1_9AGAM|nr:hypothetical protein PAXRUDRAFT_825257 [Paxillus rubicundulus Ve08.2h10]